MELKNQEDFRRAKWSRGGSSSPGEWEAETWRSVLQSLRGSMSSGQRPEYSVLSGSTSAPTPELPKALPVPDPEFN